MTSRERWQLVESLLDRALEMPRNERAAFLAEACGDDIDLRESVQRLLQACEESDGFLEVSAAEFAAPLMAAASGDVAGAPAPGSRIAHYVLEERVGAGGMGVVYRARDLKLDRWVALKFLPGSKADDQLARARLAAEARAIAALDHPNIAVVHEIGETSDGLQYIALGWYEGHTLRRALDEGRISEREAVRIAAQVAAALQAAHAAGVIHRDVKPSNILLTPGGSVRLLDFGIAKSTGIELTADGATLGTVAYMSPEQTLGATVDARTDVWSLGVVLYEMLAGERPFRGDRSDAVIYGIRHDEPPALRSAHPGMSAELEAIVAACLVKSPAERLASAGALLDRLLAVDGEWFSSAERGRLRTRRPHAAARRRPATMWLAAAGVMLVTAALGAASWRATVGRSAAPAYESNRVLVTPLENRTGSREHDVLGHMAADWIIHGLADTRLVDVVPVDRVLAAVTAGAEADESAANTVAARLARSTGAGILVTGAYYQQGDSLYFRAAIADGRSERLLHTLGPTSVPASAPLAGIEELRGRVMSALAPTLFPLHDYAKVVSKPPPFEAYRAFMHGVERFIARDFPQSITHFAAAAAADSTFSLPLIHMGAAYSIMGNHAALDSLLNAMRPRLPTLSEVDRLGYEILDARVRGDHERFYQLARQAPEGSLGTVLPWRVAGAALWVNRPREFIARMRALDPEGGELRGWRLDWISLAQAHHLLGEHRRELELARRAMQLFPGDTISMRLPVHALGAMRRTRELRELIASLGEGPPNPAVMMRHAGLELRAHGAQRDGDALLRESLEWQLARPVTTSQARLFLAESHVLVGNFAEAERLLTVLRAEEPGSILVQGVLGALAARQGHHDDALAISDGLAELRLPYHRYRTTYRRARIAAQLGDRAEAVRLLDQAYREGALFWVDLHLDPDLEPLRDYQPFRDFLRPRG